MGKGAVAVVGLWPCPPLAGASRLAFAGESATVANSLWET